MTRTVRVRLNDEEYDLIRKMADVMKFSISELMRQSTLMWIAYTSEPLINIIRSDKYNEFIRRMMDEFKNNK